MFNSENWFVDCVDATAKEADRVADQLNATGISYGSGDGATASSGIIIRICRCIYVFIFVKYYEL